MSAKQSSKSAKKDKFNKKLQELKNRVDFTKEVEDLLGISPNNILTEARTLHNYNTFLDECVEAIQEHGIADKYPDDFDDFVEKVASVKEFTDASLEYKIKARSRDEELEPEQPSKDRLSNYIEPNKFFFEYTGYVNTIKTESWIRPTGVHYTSNTELYMCLEYGNFSFQATQNAANATFRVRRVVRDSVPFLAVGAIQINMHTGLCACGVNGCGWKRSLNQTHAENRELQEYVVLSILEHLSTHSKGIVPRFVQPAKRFRDSPEAKLKSRKCIRAMQIFQN